MVSLVIFSVAQFWTVTEPTLWSGPGEGGRLVSLLAVPGDVTRLVTVVALALPFRLPDHLSCLYCSLVMIHALTSSDDIQDLFQGVVLNPLPPDLLLKDFVFNVSKDQVQDLILLPVGSALSGVAVLVTLAQL